MNEEIEQGVNESTESPAPEQTQTEAQPDSQKATPEQAEQQQKFVPYERFQELVHDRQERDTKLKAYEERIAQMEKFQSEMSRINQPAKEVNPFVAKLREIDPKYAEYIESLEGRTSKVENLERELQAMRNESLRNQYNSMVDNLHESNKVPEALRPFIKETLDAKALSGQIVTLKDVNEAYKSEFDKYAKLLETTKRETTKSYAADKSKDSNTPSSQPKGKAAGGKDPKATGNREEQLSQIAKAAVLKARAEREL